MAAAAEERARVAFVKAAARPCPECPDSRHAAAPGAPGPLFFFRFVFFSLLVRSPPPPSLCPPCRLAALRLPSPLPRVLPLPCMRIAVTDALGFRGDECSPEEKRGRRGRDGRIRRRGARRGAPAGAVGAAAGSGGRGASAGAAGSGGRGCPRLCSCGEEGWRDAAGGIGKGSRRRRRRRAGTGAPPRWRAGRGRERRRRRRRKREGGTRED